MSETPQTPGAEPSPQPESTPQPNHDAESGAAPQQPYGAQPGQQPYAAQQPGQQPYGAQPGQQPYQGAPGYAPAPLRPDEERTWAVLAHLGGIILSVFAPLIVWLVFKERSRYVDAEAKEALNFQITLVIAGIAIAIITTITFGIGAILYLAFIAALVFMIMAAVETSKGRPYRYPVNIRIIK
ncbi:DUF4870 domain-containing protein [Myceligenerans pegani]|uniref:DUF4870 domain-containing protein n=1 Tax=Myceligenerans pegani TaxID=2776917 RepID=A0ABR9N290_9MICO|nr:DUF4870 domain-containing protein [Myceligenerans sp. TRM 65318]MBE1877775.1 DUF4870 domain-containing protein [Myceligenerans sp. TRM 65318]MBE3020046.1 DUF4870 domain-containing protein [Myceligenerans sp. TRM 65318]